MLLRVWRFLTLTLIALSLAPALSHALELRPKFGYDPALYLTLQRTLYEFYGKIGGLIEVGAVLASVVLVYLVRDRRAAFATTLLGAGFMLATHAVYWIWVAPMNSLMASWPVDTPPGNWVEARNQWEYGHLARFVLQLCALAAIQASVLRETPLSMVEVEAPSGATQFNPTRRRSA